LAGYLHVTFVWAGRIEHEKVLEENYAITRMADWLAKGTEYKVRNHPVTLPRFGVAGVAMKSRHFRVNAARVFRGAA